MQVWPALESAPQAAASAAASRSASSPTMKASLPPHSATSGVRFCAQAAITFLAVAAEPVKAILLTLLLARVSPVTPAVGGWLVSSFAEVVPEQPPTAGVSSLGLNTTAFP